MLKFFKIVVVLLFFSNMNSQTLTGEFVGDKTWELENGEWSDVIYGVYAIPVTLTSGAFTITDYNFLRAMSGGRISLSNVNGYDSAEMKNPEFIDTKDGDGMKFINYKGLLQFNSRKEGQYLSIKYSIIIKDKKVFGLRIDPDGSRKAYMIRLMPKN